MIIVWVVMMSSVKGQGVHTALRSVQAVLGSQGKTFWGELAYPAAMRNAEPALGFFGEKRFMTDLHYFELGFRAGLGKQPLQFHVFHDGNQAFSDLSASASLVKKINAELYIAARLGYTMTRAKGYAGRGQPLAGVGVLFSFNEKCRWVLQADGINSFFTVGSEKDYLVRTAFGYNVSEIVAVSLEMVKEDQYPVQAAAVLSYSFADAFQANVGYSLQLGLFLLGISFETGGAEVMLTSSYHGSLGPGIGVSLLYRFKRGE